MNRLRLKLFCSILPLLAAACSSDEDPGGTEDLDSGTNGGPEQLVAELGDKGWFKYLGEFTPASQEESGPITKYRFAVTEKGPQCIDSSEYGITTRNQDSQNLVIFLMGGGACWPNFALCSNSIEGQITALDAGGPPFMDPGNSGFPTSTWNHAFLPYCDGSVFAGDREVDFFGTELAPWAEGLEIVHGLQNLSAGLDTIKTQFPSASRILLAGTSAGGFGTLWATGLVRKLYPDAELLVFNDAGLGIMKADDPEFRNIRQRDYGADDRYPDSCEECQESAHLMPVIPWGLALDPKITTAVFTADADDTIAGVFLGYEDKSIWTEALDTETTAVHNAFPDRFKRFIIPGGQHTSLLEWPTTTKDGVAIETWLGAMIDGDDSVWVDLP